MLPSSKGSDNGNHIPLVQRPALNTGQHIALNPSVKRPEQTRERGRPRLLRFLNPFDAALKGADACHCGYRSPRW